MTIQEAIQVRHSVRSYSDRKIEPAKLEELSQLMNECNGKGGLNLQLIIDDPKAFDRRRVHYGIFFWRNKLFRNDWPQGRHP